ncbi:ATP synthase subunit I [Pseudoxanthomonas kalamensis]|uniref:ATP synthase subunit I n=1 Tax=Pseudoxanthomonas kalamensis TaxID=289483 RepID=UPI001391538B|nr:ATP synthase subunit I [Pseudoxanthomonas kalamensis]
MSNSVAAGRRLALRAAVWQAVAVAIAALAFLIKGPQAAIAAAVGGAGVVLGNALAAHVALGGGVVAARPAFRRLLIATLLKWTAAITVFAVALAVWRMAPLPVLAGFATGVVAYPILLNLSVRVERER